MIRHRVPDSGDDMLDRMLEGCWINPETGLPAPALPLRDIRIMDTTEGAEADLVAGLSLGGRIAVISDPRTNEAMGRRVAQALRAIATVDDIVIAADEATIENVALLQDRARHADALIAVGSGTIQDLVKYTTFLDRRPFATFATAASMNGYTSLTASITKDGMKLSLPAHCPRGLFMDVEVASLAPAFLARAGIGDCLCRSTAQVDWRLSARLHGTPYFEVPFIMQQADEPLLLAAAGGLDKGDRKSIRILYRMLTWTGLGTCFTGTSHHGSMSEHLISHWIDMFAGDEHPDTLHGHQVGYAAISMSRLQHRVLLNDEPPELRSTSIDETAMLRRYGPAIGARCISEFKAKALSPAEARRLTEIMQDWDNFRRPLLEVMLPTARLVEALAACGGYVSAASSGLPAHTYREALLRAREIRNRFTILDVAGDSGSLADFADAEIAVPVTPPMKGKAQ